MTKSILVIEDDKNILYAVTSILESEGHTVYAAENGSLALDLLKKIPMPQLILLDMFMPIMDGLEFSRQYHALYDNQAPILIMSAGANIDQLIKDIGAAGCISKPFEIDQLLDEIKKYDT